MRILVVGGTGMIGRVVVGILSEHGDDVVIGARAPASGAGLGPAVQIGDYAAGGFSEAELEGFDAVIFAAGQDVRHADLRHQTAKFWARFQSDGVPGFFARAKRAGVQRGVQIGSYYHMVEPSLVDRVPYIRARMLADERSRAMSDTDFAVITLSASNVVGPGQRNIGRLLAWARGQAVGEVPDFAPRGGTNHISVRSLATAAVNALDRADPGAAYLVGDESLSWRDYFQLVFELSGGGRVIGEELNASHPLVSELIVPRGT